MGQISQLSLAIELKSSKYLDTQPCVRAIRIAKLPYPLKEELYAFIQRNIIPDCGRVSPNCLKAHMVKTAKNLGLSNKKIYYFKKLFKAKIGYKGYYLDAGKLRRV